MTGAACGGERWGLRVLLQNLDGFFVEVSLGLEVVGFAEGGELFVALIIDAKRVYHLSGFFDVFGHFIDSSR